MVTLPKITFIYPREDSSNKHLQCTTMLHNTTTNMVVVTKNLIILTITTEDLTTGTDQGRPTITILASNISLRMK